MRFHRFIGPFDLSQKTLTVSLSELMNQWRNVLRLKTGDQLILSDGNGSEAQATIIDMDKNKVELALSEATAPNREPKKKVTLLCALLKRENFELVVQKATELGIARIVPLLTERTVKTGFNRERLEKIIREAAEQSGRTTLTELSEPTEFADALQTLSPTQTVVFDLSGTEAYAIDFEPYVNLFIGPEGGWSEKEKELIKASGAMIASFGALTFRGETAAIIASYRAIHF